MDDFLFLKLSVGLAAPAIARYLHLQPGICLPSMKKYDEQLSLIGLVYYRCVKGDQE